VSKENRISVVIAKAGEQPELTEIDNTLEALQSAVDGWIQVINLSDRVLAVINEEGKLRGLQSNFYIPNDIVVGTAVFVGSDGEEFGSLTEGEQSEVIGFLQRNKI
jgi:hypothetical protein